MLLLQFVIAGHKHDIFTFQWDSFVAFLSLNSISSLALPIILTSATAHHRNNRVKYMLLL